MKKDYKNPQQLRYELGELQKRIAELEALESRHHRIGEDLKIQKAYLEQLFEDSPEAIVVIDTNNSVLRVNSEFTQMFGYSQEEAFGKAIDALITPTELLEEARFHSQQVKGEKVSFETKRRRKDGTELYTWVLSTPISFEGENVANYRIYRDITERRRTEEALLESESRYRRLVESITDYIYTVRVKNGELVAMSHGLGCVTVTGYTSEEYEANPELWRSIIPEEDREAVARQAEQVLAGEPFKPLEHRITHKDNSIRWVKNVPVPRHDDQGNVVAYDGLISDITERKQLQEDLARAQRLETAGRVAGQIAHDFNNLLSPLAAYPAVFREELADNHPLLGMVNEMETCANRIADINQQLLALGRRGHFTMTPVDLNDLIHNLILSQDLSKEIEVKEELTSDLFLIKAGAAQLARAIINLLVNANEAMHGKGTLSIKTKNVYVDKPPEGHKKIEKGEYVLLAISDTGSGIPQEILSKIFDPFFSTKKMDRMRGSGLGLSVVHSIMEDHNGYVTVESSESKGTTFTLYFPVSREFSGKTLEKIEKSQGGNERILVVDDDPVQWKVAANILERLGYEVHALPSGEQAVTFVKNEPQDLLVLDMVMSGIDGTETYRQILEEQPEQKAIILSGYAMTQRVSEALRLGAGTFVTKPIVPQALATAVRKELDKKSQRKLRVKEKKSNSL